MGVSLDTLRTKLVSAVTDYDKKQSKKTSYNPHALSQYIESVDEVMKLLKKGKGISLENAIKEIFTDQLADACLKVIDNPDDTDIFKCMDRSCGYIAPYKEVKDSTSGAKCPKCKKPMFNTEMGADERIFANKKAAIIQELDMIATELEPINPYIALAIDKVSDKIKSQKIPVF